MSPFGCAGRSDAYQYFVNPEQITKQQLSVVGAGDSIEVRVYQESELTGVFRVDWTGKIEYPLLGQIEVSGKNTDEIATVIRNKLQDGYVKSPQVSVLMKELNSKKIFVLGQVSKPGAIPYEDNMSIVNAIGLAGGLTTSAAPNRAKITRVVNNKERKVTVRLNDIGKGEEKNLTLYPGDIIYIPESLF